MSVVLPHRRPRPFEVAESLSTPGGGSERLNEDLVGWTDDAAWVLDGATGLRAASLLETASDARWLVQRFDKALKSQLKKGSGTTTHDSREIVRTAIAKVRTAFEREANRQPMTRFEIPSASMSFIRMREQSLDCALLGDCRLLYSGSNNSFVSIVGSAALEELDARAIRVLHHARRAPQVLTSLLWRAFAMPLLRRNRSRMNVAGGYWALSLDPAAADHIALRSLSVRSGDVALLVSDGFYRLVDTFRVFSARELVRAAVTDGLAALHNQLRNMEAADPRCLQYPRIKPSDDASAVLLIFR